MITPVYLIQTPRAGALGHRFIVPPSLSNTDGIALARKYCALAIQAEEGRDYLAIVNAQRQDTRTGAARKGSEVLVLAGIETRALSSKAKNDLHQCLLNRMADAESLITETIDWEDAGSATAVTRPELEQWGRQDSIQRYALNHDLEPMIREERQQKGGYRYRILIIFGLVLIAVICSIYFINRNDDADNNYNASVNSSDNSIWRSCNMLSKEAYVESLSLLLDDKRMSDGPYQKTLSAYQPPESIKPFVFMEHDLKKARALSKIVNIPSDGYSSITEIQMKRKILNNLFINYSEIRNSLETWQNSTGRKKEIANAVHDITIEPQKSVLPFFIVDDYDKYLDCTKFLKSLKSILDLPSQETDYEELKAKLRADTDNGGCGLAEDDAFLRSLEHFIDNYNSLGT